jgi:DNA-directed RNA polymerase specialized sigma24 family protein
MRKPYSHDLSANELLRLVRSKVEWAVEYLFDNIEKYMRRFLISQTPNYKYHAERIASLTVTIIIEKEEEPVLNCSLTTFANGIARKQWLSTLKRKHEVLMSDDYFDDQQDVEAILEQIEISDRRRLVNQSLHQISKRCQSLLFLYCHDFTPEEARQEMGYSNARVYQAKKSECFNKLKEVIIKAPEYRELFEVDEEEPDNE